jgi:hypothetical protein
VLQDAPSFFEQASLPHNVHSLPASTAAAAELFADDDDDDNDNNDSNNGDSSARPHVLVFPSNDEKALRAYCAALKQHVMDLRVHVRLRDLAFKLSEKCSRLFGRGYLVSRGADFDDAALELGAVGSGAAPRVGFVFTGQGA